MKKDDIFKIGLLFATMIVALFLFFHFDLASFFFNEEKIVRLLHSFGPLSVAIFIGLQVAQVLIAPIPGEINGFIGGYLYGPVLGTIYSTIGLTTGSLLAFMLARWLGMPFVERIVTPGMIEKYDAFMKRKGVPIAFILFLTPGFPKDALSYVIGLSHMKTSHFLVVCTAGRLLGTIMLSISGSYARNDKNIAMLIILGISALFALLMWYYHDRLVNYWRKKKAASVKTMTPDMKRR